MLNFLKRALAFNPKTGGNNEQFSPRQKEDKIIKNKSLIYERSNETRKDGMIAVGKIKVINGSRKPWETRERTWSGKEKKFHIVYLPPGQYICEFAKMSSLDWKAIRPIKLKKLTDSNDPLRDDSRQKLEEGTIFFHKHTEGNPLKGCIGIIGGDKTMEEIFKELNKDKGWEEGKKFKLEIKGKRPDYS